jgi:hypothetical protein
MNSAPLVSFFSRLNTGDLPRAYAELLRVFERLNNGAEVDQHAQAITELLWALKSDAVISDEQAQLMDADLSDARDAARQRLGAAP